MLYLENKILRSESTGFDLAGSSLTPLPSGKEKTNKSSYSTDCDTTKSHKTVCKTLNINCYSDIRQDLQGKRVLVRVDLNIEPDIENFRDHPRSQQVYKTLMFLINSGAKIVVASHLTQKNKNKKAIVQRFTAEFPELSDTITFIEFSDKKTACPVISGDRTEKKYFLQVGRKIKKLPDGNVLFLDNVRALPSENSDNSFLNKLAERTFDFVIHDAFGVSHRAGQFSNDSLFKNFPKHRKALGPCSCEEWHKLLSFTANLQDRSLALILGGDAEKFASKLGLLENIADSGKVGLVFLGGIFGYALLKANGSDFGAGKISVEDKLCERLSVFVKKYSKQIKFKTPSTYRGIIIAEDGSRKISSWKTTGKDSQKQLFLKSNEMALDQLPVKFEKVLGRLAITHVAAFGPLGYYKNEHFKRGTLKSYRNLHSWAKLASDRKIIVGGGDSMAALLELPEFQTESELVIRSSGGGAGIAALGAAINLSIGGNLNIAAIKALQFEPAHQGNSFPR